MRAPSRRATIWSLLLLGGATLASAAPTWISTTGSTVLDPVVPVHVAGTAAAPGVGAAALVLVAAALALGLVGRIGRPVVLAVAAVSGVVTVASALGIVLDPDPAATGAVAEATNVTEPTSAVVVGVAPWLTIALGVVTVLVAVWAAVGSRHWASASTRHERPTAPSTAPEREAGSGPGTSSTGRADQADPVAELDDHDAWDALTRGDDPTGVAGDPGLTDPTGPTGR